jgi:hypothetical protein
MSHASVPHFRGINHITRYVIQDVKAQWRMPLPKGK